MNFTSSGLIRKRSETDKASRYFFTLPKDISEQIQIISKSFPRNGRWSVKVKSKIWWISRNTSIFPDKKSGCYLLPIKAEVRKKLTLEEGMNIAVDLELI